MLEVIKRYLEEYPDEYNIRTYYGIVQIASKCRTIKEFLEMDDHEILLARNIGIKTLPKINLIREYLRKKIEMGEQLFLEEVLSDLHKIEEKIKERYNENLKT